MATSCSRRLDVHAQADQKTHYPEIWDLIFLKYYENGGHWWWPSYPKLKDGTPYLKALNDHCSQGLLARHWTTDYNDDIKRNNDVERMKHETASPSELLVPLLAPV